MKILKFNELDDKFFEYKKFEGIDIVNSIIEDVKNNGDKAIRAYSAKFGDGDFEKFEVTQAEIDNAINQTPKNVIGAIKKSVENVKNFAKRQFETIMAMETEIDGSTLGHRIISIEKTGSYVPGGNYPLPSSAIMTVVPAKVAGVKEVIVCSPKIQPVTIAACKIAGADRIFKIGGVQAIAAMAYGTETIPKVDKIVGPGNKFVTAAKKEVYGICGIDFLAGPSEVMIVADETSNPKFVAADMLAQAEHDKEAQAVLITTSQDFANTVIKAINEFLSTLETALIAKEELKNSCIILIDNIEQAIELLNKKAHE
ncbi:MAG: histidinol dehydrogenase, partial [Candidatus Gastranaerophilales bacterium]|nr:histidinol dehydrogenase [Candidatus Gastranaerophilales bacterium]